MAGPRRRRTGRSASARLAFFLTAGLAAGVAGLAPAIATAAPQGSDPLQLDPADRARFVRSAEAPPLAATPTVAGSPASAPSPWAGTLELYGHLPLRTTTKTTIEGFTAESTLSLGQLLDALQGVVAIRGSVENGRLGLLTDISYVSLQGEKAIERSRDRIRLGDGRLLGGVAALRNGARDGGDGRLPEGLRGRLREGLRGRLRDRIANAGDGLRDRLANRGEVVRERGALAARLAARERGEGPVTRTFRTQINSEQGIYDVALRYRLGARESAVAEPGTVTVIPYAGIRILDVGLDIDSELSGSRGFERAVARSFGSPVVQPLLGTQAQVFVAPRLRLFARGDLGGFGVSGNDSFSGNAQVGVGYAIGNSTQLDLSWRYLHLAANNGKDPENAYVIGANGLELGLKFFF